MPTLTDPDQDKLNPAAQQEREREAFNEDFGSRGTLNEDMSSGQGAIDQARSRLGRDLNAAENTVAQNAPTATNAADIQNAELDPKWTTQLQNNTLVDKTTQRRGGLQNPIVKRWLIAGAISLVMSAFALMSQVPTFALIQIKKLASQMMDRDTTNTNSRRKPSILKRWFNADPNCKAGVECMMKVGITDNELKQLERAGLTLEVQEAGQGKKRLVSMMAPGQTTKITIDNLDDNFRTNIAFLSAMNSAFGTEDFVNRGPETIKKTKFAGMIRKKFTDSTDPAKIKQAFRKFIYSGDGSSINGRLGSCTQSTTGGSCADPQEERNRVAIQNQLGDAFEEINNGGAQQRAELESSNYERPPSINPDMTHMDADPGQALGIVGKTVKSAFGAAFKGVYAVAEKGCMMLQLIRTITLGAKIYMMMSLIQYISPFLAASDSLIAGEGNYAITAFLMGMLLRPSTEEGSKGKTFFDGPFLGFMTEGKINDRKGLARYVGGSSPMRMIAAANNFVTGSGASVQTCRHINSWYGSMFGVATGLLTLVFTGGTVNAGAIAASVAAQVIISVLSAYAIPLLIQYAAGTLVPDELGPEGGYGVSGALMAGTMWWRHMRGKALGDRTQTKAEVAATQHEATEQLALETRAANYGKSPFSLDQPNSISSRLAMKAMPFMLAPASQSNYQNVAALASSPFNLLASSLGKIISPSVSAQNNNSYAGEYCQDADTNAMGIATDAMCVPIDSEKAAKLQGKKYAPEKVIEYLLSRNHIDSERNLTSEEHKKFAADCLDGIIPITPDGRGIDITEDIDTRKCLVSDTADDLNSDSPNYDGEGVMYDMFRFFRRDMNIQQSITDSANGTLGLSPEDVPSDAPITGPLNPGAFTWPIAPSGVSTISSCMNQTDPSYRLHSGLDIAAPLGTTIVAVADGEVVFESKNVSGFGYYIAIKHANGSITGYGHNIENLVQISDTVKQGQPIAKVGSRGQSTGPHLHMNYIPDGSSPFTTKTNSFNPLFNNLMPKPDNARDAAGCMTPNKLKAR